MKALRRSFVFVLCMVCMMLSTTLTAQATEFEKSSVVTIVITDESTGNPAEEITIEFFDVETGMLYSVDVKKGHNWQSIIELPAENTFAVIVRGLEEPFTLVESNDHSKKVMEQSYSYTEVVKEEYWSIVGTKEEESSATGEGQTKPQGTPVSYEGMTAKEAYEAFLDEVSFIETDEGWVDFLTLYGKDSPLYNLYAKRHSVYYADYVQGGTAEKYLELSNFEQFLWTETYTKLAYDSYGSGDYAKYFGDRVHFDKYVVELATAPMQGYPNSDVVIAAFEKLMDWQYNYIVTEGNQIPYCFITDRSSLEEVSDPVVNVPDSSETISKEEQEDIEELEQAIKDALEEEESNEKAEEEKGIWDDTFAILADNALSLLILVVLLVVLGVAVYRRKKRNID